MWIPMLLSLFSMAHAGTPVLTLTITDPTGAEHVLSGEIPLETESVLEMGKASHRFVIRASQSGEKIKVMGELHEQKGSKDKIVRYANFTLPAEGTNRAERISWGAPKGATVPDGLNPDLLAWRVVAEWMAPVIEEAPPEVIEEATEEPAETAPVESEAPTGE